MLPVLRRPIRELGYAAAAVVLAGAAAAGCVRPSATAPKPAGPAWRPSPPRPAAGRAPTTTRLEGWRPAQNHRFGPMKHDSRNERLPHSNGP